MIFFGSMMHMCYYITAQLYKAGSVYTKSVFFLTAWADGCKNLKKSVVGSGSRHTGTAAETSDPAGFFDERFQVKRFTKPRDPLI